MIGSAASSVCCTIESRISADRIEVLDPIGRLMKVFSRKDTKE